MDIRIIIAVGLSAAILALAWFLMRARGTKAARLEEEVRVNADSDRVASERLSRLAAARREQEERQAEADDDEPAELEAETDEAEDEYAPPALAEPDPEPEPEEEPEEGPEVAGPDGWTTVLRPQVLISPDAPRRSWLGGRPHLPQGTGWPEADGARLVFFAGLCLADLDERMWNGLGPREGWLLIFLHPRTHAPHCLHVPAIGTGEDERPETFAPGYELFNAHGGLAQDEARGSRVPRCFAEWPVKLDLYPERGENDHRSYTAATGPKMAGEMLDFAKPALFPVDEFAAVAMLDAINDDFARLRTTRYADAEEGIAKGKEAVEALRRALAATLEAEQPDQQEAEKLRKQLSQAEELHNSFVSEVETNSAAEAHLQQLADMVRDHALKRGLKPTEIAQVMQGLSEVPVAWRTRAGKVGDEKITLTERPITQVSPGDPHPGSSLVAVATEHAKHAFTRRPEILTEPQQRFWTQRFAQEASRPLGKIGGWPVGYVSGFDGETEALLLELETSELVGWIFGDSDRLSLTLPREALRDGVFDTLSVKLSNG